VPSRARRWSLGLALVLILAVVLAAGASRAAGPLDSFINGHRGAIPLIRADPEAALASEADWLARARRSPESRSRSTSKVRQACKRPLTGGHNFRYTPLDQNSGICTGLPH